MVSPGQWLDDAELEPCRRYSPIHFGHAAPSSSTTTFPGVGNLFVHHVPSLETASSASF
jgi:hypothetical protein